MRTITIAVVALLIVEVVARSTEISVTSITPRTIGMGGKVRITIYGDNFSKDQFSQGEGNENLGNYVRLVNVDDSQDSLVCDIHIDGCTPTQIMCYTPVNLSANAVYMAKVKVDGQNVPDCTNSKCKITVRESYTPNIKSITPYSGKAGDIILEMYGRLFTDTFGSSQANASNGREQKISRSFAPQTCEIFKSTDVKYRLELDPPTSDNGYLKCKPAGTYVGCATPSILVEAPFGGSTLDGSLEKINNKGVKCVVEYYTEIDSVSPAKSDGSVHGSVRGGLNITIKGDYFETAGNQSTYSPAEAYVGGQVCDIVHVERDKEIICTVPPTPATPPSFYCGGRGILVESWNTAFSTYDAAIASEDTSGSVEWFDETRYCGNITKNLTRMTGVFDVPFNGNYSFQFKADAHGKLVILIDGNEVSVESTGNWAGTSVYNLKKGDLIKLVAIGKPGTSDDSCVEIMSKFFDTKLTPKDTGHAHSERQGIRLKSKVENQNYTVKFSNFQSRTPRNEKQTVCVSGSDSIYRLGLFGVYTPPVDLTVPTKVQEELKKLPVLFGSDSFTVVQNTNQACIDITFNSNRGDIPLLQTKPTTDVSVSETVSGLSNNMIFAFNFTNVPSPPITYDESNKTKLAEKMKDALYGMFSVQCPDIFTGKTARFYEGFENGPATSGASVTAEVASFCGRYSCKNCLRLFPISARSVTALTLALHRWLCYAIRNHDNKLIFLKLKDKDDGIKQAWFEVNSDIYQDGDWAYKCVDIKQEFETKLAHELESSKGYKLIEARIFNYEDDLWVDDISFGQRKPIGELADISHTRLGAASPNPNMNATIDWLTVDYDSSNDQYNISIAPFNCLYDFHLLTLAGGSITGDHTSSSNTVSSTLKTSTSPAGTMDVDVTNKASKPIKGNINVGFNGSFSGDFDAQSTDEGYKNRLESIEGIGTLSVERTATSTCANMEFDVVFTDSPGNKDKMTITSAFTSNNEATAEIIEKSDGYLAIQPIPGNMVCTYHKTSQVRLVINDIPTKCAQENHQCAFIYSNESTPNITAIDKTQGNQNDVLTITGEGFDATKSENMVTIGGTPCEVTSSTTSQIVCTVGPGELGSYPVDVTVVGKGKAAGTKMFKYTIELTGISPDINTLAGHGNLTVSGKGLSPNVNVYFGDQECNKTYVDIPTKIYCTIPPFTNLCATSNQSVTVSVKSGDEVLGTFPFTYFTIDAAISSIATTNDLTVHGGQTVTINGADFGTDSSDKNIFIKDTQLEIDTWTDAKIEAVTPEPTPPGKDLKLLILNGPLGAIPQSCEIPRIDVTLDVYNVCPTGGSLHGGTPLTIGGQGFGNSKDDVKVTVGPYACNVDTLTNTEIGCVIEATSVTHEVTNQGSQGLGAPYAFSHKTLTIRQGDCVRWRWSTPEYITAEHGIAQTDSPTSQEDKADGISSGPNTREGSFKACLVKPGEYFFWSRCVKSTGCISYRMKVTVVERTAEKQPIRVIVAGQEAAYNLSTDSSKPTNSFGCTLGGCGIDNCNLETVADVDSTKVNFLFTKCLSPIVDSTTFTPVDSSSSRSVLTTTDITFGGSGFSDTDSANIGKIGNCSCTRSQSTAKSFVCTPDASCAHGIGVYKPLTLDVLPCGTALMNIMGAVNRSVVFLPLIRTCSPASGSSQGGTEVTYTGTGLSGNPNEISVTFDGIAGECAQGTDTSLTCTTPYRSVTGSAPVVVKVKGVPAVLETTCKFTYDAAITPKVTAVSPAKVSPDTTLTITGEKFGADPSKISVTVGGQNCGEITISNNQVECVITALPKGVHPPVLTVEGIGKAVTNANVNVTCDASASVNPQSGSVYGGTLLTFTGHCFVEGLSIQVDGNDICESIDVKSFTEVECVTLAHNAADATIEIQDKSVSYEFSNAASPLVTSVSPTAVAVGDTVTIQGDKFGTDASKISVFIGNVECTNVILTSTSVISCETQPQSSGTHGVQVDVLGNGKSNSDVMLTIRVIVTSLDPSSGDSCGNQLLKVIGNGLNKTQQVKVCDKVCEFYSLPSSREYVCITPPGTTGVCSVKVIEAGTNNVITSTVNYEYQANVAPTITSISPPQGGTGGYTEVTIKGLLFSDTKSDVTVTIDGVPCVVSSSTTTQIVCNTGAHPTGSKMSEVVVSIIGVRATACDSSVLQYYYVDVWNSTLTWGGEQPPAKGEFVVIPQGQHILLDADTPVLEMLIIQGNLTFDDADLTLRAKCILITSGGKLQIGSEDQPFQKKAKVELHGHARDKDLPIYGSKCLAVRNGTLALYGNIIQNTWTKLAATAAVNSATITVQDSIDDWKVDDEIFIASTGPKDSTNENEKRKITAISGKTITLDKPLEFEHLGNSETYSGNGRDMTLEFRAEVGLLTRNVVVQGNSEKAWETKIEKCEKGFHSGEFVTQTCFQGRFGEETGSDQFGAHIIFHGPVRDSQVAKAYLSYIEVTHAGQAFRLGRYPIHFHLNGDMSKSFVRGCSIHKTFNRAINIHGSHNILIEKNVAFDVMGGAFFLEDGIETGNKYLYNFVGNVKASSSLLNDDVTPAAFWVTNANNTYEYNTAAGGTHFGFWLRIHKHPDGPSFRNDYCPQHVPVKSFKNNTAHSFGWFGIWVFEEYYPAADGACNPVSSAPAVFEYSSFWNCEKGVELVNYGSLIFDNCLFVQNNLAGFEGKITKNAPKRDSALSPIIKNSIIVGKANSLASQNSKGATEVGIVLPYGGLFQVKNVSFLNFGDAVAFRHTKIDGTCSVDCGGYPTVVSGLEFTDTPNRVDFRWEHEGILEDLDGSLCGTSPSKVIPVTGTATSVPTTCQTSCSGYMLQGGLDAAVCPYDYRLHRFSFNDPYPSSVVGKDFRVTNRHGSSSSPYRTHRLTHKDGWMVILINCEIYNFTFENAEEMTNVSFSGIMEDFKAGDCVIFQIKLREMPDEVTVDGGKTKSHTAMDPFDSSTTGLQTGNWSYSNGSLRVAIVGDESSGGNVNVDFRAYRCFYPRCEPPPDPEATPPQISRPEIHQRWSESIWVNDTDNYIMRASMYNKSGAGPSTKIGQNVTIEQGLWVVIKKKDKILKLGTLIIKGCLEIDYAEDLDFVLEANFIIILGGCFQAGWKDNPMIGTLNIVLTGSEASPWYTKQTGYNIGSKAIAVFGGLQLIAPDRDTWVRLNSTVSTDDKVLTIEDKAKISKWRKNDKILITSTSSNQAETEEAEIQSIDYSTGRITLKKKLLYRHAGGYETVGGRRINLSAHVGLLTQPIVVEGQYVAGEAYGGRILVSVTTVGENNDVTRSGYACLRNVEFRHMGHDGYIEDADLRSAVAFMDTGRVTDIKPSEVTGCVYHDLFNSAVGVVGVEGLVLQHNIVYKSLRHALMTASHNTTINGNLIVSNQFTGTYDGRFEQENAGLEAAIEAIRTTELHLHNNSVVGSERFGFHVPGENCDSDISTSKYSNNAAFGNLYGVVILPGDKLDQAGIKSCTRLSSFLVSKNYDYGVYYNNMKSVKLDDTVFVDENVAFFPMVFGPSPLTHTCGNKIVEVRNSIAIGTSSVTDCSAETQPSGNYMIQNSGNLRSKRGPSSERQTILMPPFSGGSNNCGEKKCFGIMSYNAICGQMIVTGVTFKSFKGEQSGCKAAFTVSTMKGNDDMQFPLRISDVTLIDVDEDYKALFHRPDVGKVNPADCVDMDCDGKKKAIIKAMDDTFMGATGTFIAESEYEWDGDPRRGLGDYRIPKTAQTLPNGTVLTVNQLARNGKGIVRTSACVKKTVSNGKAGHHWCPALQHEMLVIESMDADTEMRRLSPVAIITGGYIDLINGPQDHGWCFGYTCQKRISTFHAIVLPGTSQDEIVQVYFSSTPPEKTRFALLDAENKCVIVGLYYLKSCRIDAFVGGKYILTNNADKAKWDANKDLVLKNEPGADYMPTCELPNGNSYFDREAKIIYFAVKGGVELANAVELKCAPVVIVTFGFPAMTPEQFFQDENIIENIALFLNIPSSKIRVVKVIAAGSRRKRRSTDSGSVVTLEFGSSPTDTPEESEEPDVKSASALMDSCQEGTIGSTLGVPTTCEELFFEETIYTPIQPDELWFFDTVLPQHEGVPFTVQPKIRAYDTNGDIVDHLGLEESPWEITATLRSCDPACGHANAVLTGTLTVSSANGWFNFTDLQLSHKGEGYIIDFEVTSPSGVNITLETEPFSVDGLPMTAGVYSMTSGDIPQDSTFTLTLDLRDSSTDVPIPDITWRDHTSFDVTCDLVGDIDTGNFTGTLSKTFDSSTGRASFNDLKFSGYGLFYIACMVASTPKEYEFYSFHQVFVLGTHQANTLLEASNTIAVRYKLDYNTTLPTLVAAAQLEQATVMVFTLKWPGVVIRQSSIKEGSIIVTFTIEGESLNVTETTKDMCKEITSGMKVTVGSTTLTLDGYMTVDGSDYFSSCEESDEDSGLHPAIIAMIVLVCLLLIGLIVFLLIWRFKIRPKSKTHGADGDDSNNGLPGGFYYLDNGRMVYVTPPSGKMNGKKAEHADVQTENKAPLTTLYDETRGAFFVRRSPQPPIEKAGSKGLTPTGM